MKIPGTMMDMLRGRYGLEDGDKSMDREIEKLSPVDLVRECTAWKLGDAYWAVYIARWMKAVGAKPEDF